MYSLLLLLLLQVGEITGPQVVVEKKIQQPGLAFPLGRNPLGLADLTAGRGGQAPLEGRGCRLRRWRRSLVCLRGEGEMEQDWEADQSWPECLRTAARSQRALLCTCTCPHSAQSPCCVGDLIYSSYDSSEVGLIITIHEETDAQRGEVISSMLGAGEGCTGAWDLPLGREGG